VSVDIHRRVEKLVAQAEGRERSGQHDEVRRLYLEAAGQEAEVFRQIPPSRVKTRGIIAVNVVSLFWRAGAQDKVAEHAREYLAQPDLPDFARGQLLELLANQDQSPMSAHRDAEQAADPRDTFSPAGEPSVVGHSVKPSHTLERSLERVETMFQTSLREHIHKHAGMSGRPFDSSVLEQELADLVLGLLDPVYRIALERLRREHEREYRVLLWRGTGISFAEIGEGLALSEELTRQAASRGRKHLREYVRALRDEPSEPSIAAKRVLELMYSR